MIFVVNEQVSRSLMCSAATWTHWLGLILEVGYYLTFHSEAAV